MVVGQTFKGDVFLVTCADKFDFVLLIRIVQRYKVQHEFVLVSSIRPVLDVEAVVTLLGDCVAEAAS